MTKRERDRRRREKHQAQKMRRRENVIEDAERRLLGSGALPKGWSMTTYAMTIPLGQNARKLIDP